MNAGRELDALVAEKVMGAHFLDPSRPPIHIPGAIPEYSTDVTSAWEVVERVFYLPINRDWIIVPVGRSLCEIRDRLSNNLIADGYTMPEAVCLAALKAVGAL